MSCHVVGGLHNALRRYPVWSRYVLRGHRRNVYSWFYSIYSCFEADTSTSRFDDADLVTQPHRWRGCLEPPRSSLPFLGYNRFESDCFRLTRPPLPTPALCPRADESLSSRDKERILAHGTGTLLPSDHTSDSLSAETAAPKAISHVIRIQSVPVISEISVSRSNHSAGPILRSVVSDGKRSLVRRKGSSFQPRVMSVSARTPKARLSICFVIPCPSCSFPCASLPFFPRCRAASPF